MQRYDKSIMLIAIFLLPLIIYFAGFSSLVYNQIFYVSLLEKTSVDIPKASELTKYLFGYFRNNDYSVPEIVRLNYDENSHIRDVKIVIKNVFLVFYFIVPIFALALFFAKNKQKVFFYGSIFGILLPVLFSVVAFPVLFTIFHQVFFPQGNWIFSENSTLVSTYTFDFFKLFALQILIEGEFISVVIFVYSLFRKHMNV